MATTFDEWLRALATSGRLWPVPVVIDRGLPFSYPLVLAGDWTGAEMTSALRRHPDDADVEVALTVSAPAFDAAAARTTFTLSLTEAQTAALPADPAGEAVVRLAWDVLFEPAGLSKARLTGRDVIVLGKVTNG